MTDRLSSSTHKRCVIGVLEVCTHTAAHPYSLHQNSTFDKHSNLSYFTYNSEDAIYIF